MAIGAPAQRAIAEPTAQLGTTVVTIGTTVALGSLCVLTATNNANKTISSIVDSVGNTWVVDKTATDATRTINFASTQVGVAIPSGTGTITITWSAATSSTPVIWVHEIANAATSSAFDQFGSGTGSGTAMLTTATSVLTQADELVFGCFRTAGGGTWTKGATYSNPTTPTSTTTLGSSLEYKIVAATTAVTADGTWSTTGAWAGLCVTYKGVAAASTSRYLSLLGAGT